MMLDTRSYERDKQLDIEKYFEGNSFNKISYLKDLNKPRKLLGKNPYWTKDRKNCDQVSPLHENLQKKKVRPKVRSNYVQTTTKEDRNSY